MKISAKIDYACKALLELCLHYPNKTPLPITTIAENQDIPIKFLTQILLSLKQFGFVKSVRGKSGGYLLNTTPKEITLKGVVVNFDGLGINPEKESIYAKTNDVFEEVWDEIEAVIIKKMKSINFEQIKDKYQKQSENLMYMI